MCLTIGSNCSELKQLCLTLLSSSSQLFILSRLPTLSGQLLEAHQPRFQWLRSKHRWFPGVSVLKNFVATGPKTSWVSASSLLAALNLQRTSSISCQLAHLFSQLEIEWWSGPKNTARRTLWSNHWWWVSVSSLPQPSASFYSTALLFQKSSPQYSSMEVKSMTTCFMYQELGFILSTRWEWSYLVAGDNFTEYENDSQLLSHKWSWFVCFGCGLSSTHHIRAQSRFPEPLAQIALDFCGWKWSFNTRS